MSQARPNRENGTARKSLIRCLGVAASDLNTKEAVNFIRREFWRHRPTGQFWAVELHDNVLHASAGPLGRGDVDAILLPHLPYERRYVGWMRDRLAEFSRTPAALECVEHEDISDVKIAAPIAEQAARARTQADHYR